MRNEREMDGKEISIPNYLRARVRVNNFRLDININLFACLGIKYTCERKPNF